MDGELMMQARPFLTRLLMVSAAGALLCSCESAARNKGEIEIKNAAKVGRGPVFVLEAFHHANPGLESKLAADLRGALAKRGFEIAPEAAKAKLVLLATPGRVRVGSGGNFSQARLERSPLLAGGSTGMTRASDVAAARLLNAPASGGGEAYWKAGLLLTAVDRKEFEEFGKKSDSLPHVWRAYASAPLVKPVWSSVSPGLVQAVADAAAGTIPSAQPAKPQP
jgi:hypothetical protein